MTAPRDLGNLFLSIGSMKAGTTWLYSVLSKHPELNFSREKEIHYFYHRYVSEFLTPDYKVAGVQRKYLPSSMNPGVRADMVRASLNWCSAYLGEPTDDPWFGRLFPRRPETAYRCEFSNLTAHVPEEGWRDILAKSDRLKVVYTVRDPLKRLWSHVKFDLEFNGKLDTLDSWDRADLERYARQPHIWNNAEYGQVIGRLRRALPAEAWRVYHYEDIHRTKRELLRNIEDFLGIAPFDYPDWLLDQRPTEGPRRDAPPYFREMFLADAQRIAGEMQAQGVEPHPSWGL